MKPSPNEVKEPSAKKPYETPRLQIYGSLPEITNTVSNMGHATDDFLGSTRTR
jgi:hypothetical protein